MSSAFKNAYYSSNDNKTINSIEFIKTLCDNIENVLKRRITTLEKQHVITYIRKINPKSIEVYPITQVKQIITEKLVENFLKKQKNYTPVNTHELLKAQIGLESESDNVSNYLLMRDTGMNLDTVGGDINSTINGNDVKVVSFLGSSDMKSLKTLLAVGGGSSSSTPLINSTILGNGDVSPYYLNNMALLDSRYRMLDTDGSTQIQWNHVNNLTRQQGTFNTIGDISNIVAIRVMELRIPYTASADNKYKRISLLFDEWSAQSVVGQENRRYHMMFESEVDGRWINLRSQNFNDGWYKFSKPITQLDTLTASFASPLEPIVFDLDRMSFTVSSYGLVTEFTTTLPHNLQTGDRIYMTTFNTLNLTRDEVVIDTINSTSGHLISVINSTTVDISVDTSSINSLLTGTVSASNGLDSIMGTGTLFLTEIQVNDYVRIIDSLLIERVYKVIVVTSNTVLQIEAVYDGPTEVGRPIYLDNRTPDLSFTIYFGEKRIFIPFEITFLPSTE
jgi:hypothetical protein